ncbi:MAG: type II CAAX endopeptidase family protein [Planctomycetota bacterium]
MEAKVLDSENRPPRVWPILLIIPTSLVAFLIASFLAIPIAYVIATGTLDMGLVRKDSLKTIMSSRAAFTFVVVMPQIALMTPALIASLLSPEPIRRRLGLVRGYWPYWTWVTAAITTPIIGWISSIILGSLMSESESLQMMTDTFRQLGKGGFLIPLACIIGLTPAICEEVLFRGYVQTRLNQRIGPFFGIAVSSFLFAVFHMDPVQSLAVFPIGVYLGLISWKSGSLLPAMLGHFVNNAISVIAALLGPASMDDTISPEFMLFIFVVGVAGLGSGAITTMVFFVYPRLARTEQLVS